MKTYEKITLKHAGRQTTKFYQVINESPIFVFAREVDKEGEDKDFYNKENVLVQTVHMIDKGLIKKRVKMVIDKKYGELVPMKIYKDLKVGDAVVCIEDFSMDEDDKIPFHKGGEYTVTRVNILDDGTKVIDMINDQGYEHGMDNEEYPTDPDGHHYDFDSHFVVKQ